MATVEMGVDAREFGFDPTRLERVGAHFDRYVEDGRLAGFLTTVARGGQVVYQALGGHRDKESGAGMAEDTIFRIYSMTKPITSVAAMMLYEEGCFDLNDDAGRWIDSLAAPRVYVSGPPTAPVTRPATEPVRIHHLLSHMSGLTYGFQHLTVVDAIYRRKGYEFGGPPGADLATVVDDWCTSPLLFEPGSRWNYSVSVDVLGRLIEIWSGMSLDAFFRERLLDPLGMVDTDWYVPEDKLGRLAQLYVPINGQAVPYEEMAKGARSWPSWLGGGGGLCGTAGDYQRFMSMLVGGGELDGRRYLSERTLGLMTENHLPGDVDLASFASDSFGEVDMAGVGFGLGFSVVIDSRLNKSLVTEGNFAWGGAASTAFWVDPLEEITVGFFTQLLPSTTYPIRRELQQLVYSALED